MCPWSISSSDLLADLVLGEGTALDLLVAGPEGAVQALVGAQVGDVERSEHDQPAAVDLLLDLAGRGEQLAEQVGVAHLSEGRHLLLVQPLQLERLGDDVADVVRVPAAAIPAGRRRCAPRRWGRLPPLRCNFSASASARPRRPRRGRASVRVARHAGERAGTRTRRLAPESVRRWRAPPRRPPSRRRPAAGPGCRRTGEGAPHGDPASRWPPASPRRSAPTAP